MTRILLLLLLLAPLLLLRPLPVVAQATDPATDLVATAHALLGTPYQWAGYTPATGFDCSGFTHYVAAQVGIALPRTAAEQARAGPRVALTDLAPGDLVVFAFAGAAEVSHVALYVGDGWMIHAPAPGSVVSLAPLWADDWWPHAVHGVRITGAGGDGMPIFGPPEITRDQYIAILCTPRNGQVPAPCPEAGDMYDLLIDWGANPLVQLGFAGLETELGTTGPGRPPQRNLHNLECNDWDGGTCTGPHHMRFQAYPSYLHSTYAWVALLRTNPRYVPAGRDTLEEVSPIYAPAFENDVPGYIASIRRLAGTWGGGGLAAPPAPTITPTPAPTATPVPAAEPCGAAMAREPVALVAEPGGEPLRTLDVGEVVLPLCRNAVAAHRQIDGQHWVQVTHPDLVVYAWVPLAALEKARLQAGPVGVE